MIYGDNIYKLKRFIVLSVLMFILCNYVFSIDKKIVYNSIVHDTNYSQFDIEKISFVNDDYCVSLIKEHSYMQDTQTILITSNMDTRSRIINSRFKEYNYKYIELIDNTSAFLADATFDDRTDIIWLIEVFQIGFKTNRRRFKGFGQGSAQGYEKCSLRPSWPHI